MKNIQKYQNDNYLTLQVNEPQKVLNFLTERMGFIISPAGICQKNNSTANLKCITLRNSYGDHYLLPLNSSNPIINKSLRDKTIVINTDDCLKAYYNLRKAEEISFHSKPKYLSEGLAFEASDKWGNCYILLEKRNYTDN